MLEIQPVPCGVFFRRDRWMKSWMYHLDIRETRGVAMRIVEATFDVMGTNGLLRRDAYDSERLAQRMKPMTVRSVAPALGSPTNTQVITELMIGSPSPVTRIV